jgi:low affinity Fe/Cu permease
MSDHFASFAAWIAQWSGKPHVFAAAVASLVLWALFGPLTGYSQDWQLVINTGTTILTFLMVFIIQNTQNRHTTALQIKLDEVIRAIDGARDELIDLEELSEAELARLQKRFRKLGARARNGGGVLNARSGEQASPRKLQSSKPKLTQPSAAGRD